MKEDVTKTEFIKLPVSSAPFLSNLYRFDELTTMQLYDVLQLRAEVFVVEQDCVYQDVDGNDTQALHLLIYDAKRLVAYARIFLPGVQDPQHAIIGRVVVRQAYRKEGLGKKLMNEAIAVLSEQGRTPSIKISAQSHLQNFYSALGFIATGKDYLEDGIPHSEMIRP